MRHDTRIKSSHQRPMIDEFAHAPSGDNVRRVREARATAALANSANNWCCDELELQSTDPAPHGLAALTGRANKS